MPDEERLLSEIEWTSAKVSSQIWILNLGILGTTWSLLISAATDAKLKVTFSEARWIILLCLLSLFCDLAQYLSAYFLNKRMHTTMEEAGLKRIEYDKDNLLYRMRSWCFWGKIGLTALAALLLIWKLFTKLA